MTGGRGERLPEESCENKGRVDALVFFFFADTRAEQSAGDLKGREVLVDVEFLHEVTRRKYMALPPADGGRKDELTCC